jgi:ribonuclease E
MGTIRSVESLALAILRLIGEEARKERSARIIVQVPVDVGTYLMNEKRDWLNTIGERSSVNVVLIPNQNLQTPNYSIRRVRDDETLLAENSAISYQMVEQEELLPDAALTRDKKPTTEAPAVPTILPTAPAPVTSVAPPSVWPGETVPQRPGIFVRLWRWLFGAGTVAPAAPKPAPSRQHREHRDDRRDRYRDNRRGARDRDVRRDHHRGAQGQHRGDGHRRPESHQPKRESRPSGASAPVPAESRASNERATPEPRNDTTRVDRATRNDRAERSERGGRGRRGRRRRGGRDRGDAREGSANSGNGPETAPAQDRIEPAAASASDDRPASSTDSGRTAELPFSPANQRTEPARSNESQAPRRDDVERPASHAATGTETARPEDKYVVWSSSPSDSTTRGPGRDD